MLIVQRDFTQQIHHTLMSFKAGAVVQDQVLEGLLLLSHAPVEEVAKKEDLIHCPHCKRPFTVRQAVQQDPKTKSHGAKS